MKETRRDFLMKTGCALSMVGLATQARHFGLMSAMAQTVDENAGGNDGLAPYRALVCVFLSGGNDANNMIIPVHNSTSISNYTAYSNARSPQSLAFTQAQLAATNINVPRMGNLAYAFHPNFGDATGTTPPGGSPNRGIHELWAQGKLAAVTNVGNLVRPMTRAQYLANSVQRPFQLFSHSDQVSQQQTSRSDRKVFTGWGGLISDKTTGLQNPTGLIPMITTINGSQLFTSGMTTSPLAVAAGNVPLNQALVLNGFGTDTVSVARRTSFDQLRTFDRTNNVVKAAQDVTSQAIQASQALSTFQEVTVAFPTSGIGNQLKQVARLIKKRTELNVTRQIFYVQIGGFDTHNGQVATNTTGQNGLLLQLSQALRAFYDEMVAQNVADSVTAFTLSDFNRTFNPAGSGTGVVGSDHAWGSHALVLGGGVRGGDFYGVNTTNGTPFPSLVFAGPDDADNGSGARGRWIPTTSVDQYAATLSAWYGLPAGDRASVFPNLANFTTSDLGFMVP